MTRENTKDMLKLFCALEGLEQNFSEQTLDTIHSLIRTRIAIEKCHDIEVELHKEVDEFVKAIEQ